MEGGLALDGLQMITHLPIQLVDGLLMVLETALVVVELVLDRLQFFELRIGRVRQGLCAFSKGLGALLVRATVLGFLVEGVLGPLELALERGSALLSL